jgi:Flp pilus assembly protein TadG
VELAIVLIILVFFLFGTIQFGFAFHRYQGLQAAAREGARIAAVGGTPGEVKTRVQNAQSMFNAADVQVRIDYSTDDGKTWPGNQLVCDDASGQTQCKDANGGSPSVCSTVGIGNLVRVTATVPASSTYSIAIPLWGNKQITYSGTGVFQCEQV